MVVLPCGAGKTLVGAAAMAEAKATTLILVTNTVAGRQWKRELIAASLTEEEIGEYSGERKEIRPVTIATYQVLTSRRRSGVHPPGPVRRPRLGPGRLRRVHLLPAPIFRFPADLQARRRLGTPPRLWYARTAVRATCSA
ncbi:DEAD/DEAH box helicase family protein [Micromonospora sp. BRA006-A]|nr:DEAD/DEAH box helicase family protein [Micromonospora sp. BRA006-A]